jgi:mono/diheme cytochrome c family protein
MRRLVILLPLVFTTLAVAAEPDGAVRYRNACVLCHAADGSGNTPAGKSMKARDLRSAEVQKQSDGELAKVVADGRGKMPGYKSSMSPEEIHAIVGYLRTFAKK